MTPQNHSKIVQNGLHYTKATWENDGDISSSSSGHEEQTLIDMLYDSMLESKFEKTSKPYLPQDVLDGIFFQKSNKEEKQFLAILKPMGSDPAAPSENVLSLAKHILKTSRRVFLIAVFMELKAERLRKVMFMFRQHDFTDANLPLDVWLMEKLRVDATQHPFAAMEDPNIPTSLRIWSFRQIVKFQSEQWRFLAPKISTAEPLHDFGQHTIPFITKHPLVSKGAYGTVYKYEIHPAHFEDPVLLSTTHEDPLVLQDNDLSQINQTATIFAVKEIRKEGHEVAKHWETEVKALARMNQLNQKHIVRFITAFRRGNLNDIEHYVMFEWADGGNLSDLWNTCANPVLTAARTRWAIRQLYGLAQALSKAHYLEVEGQHDGASYRHGDLKPANILWFKQGDSDFGTLKIGDWGEAKEHNTVTALRHDTTAQYGTRRYEPPEVVTGVQSNLSQESRFVRSRLYDIWGIGCITLEFIIWLMYGVSELKRFNKENIGDYGTSDMFYEVSREKPAKVHGVVEYWMEHMAKDPRCARNKTALGDLLDIVRKGLLIVKLPPDGGAQRPHAHPDRYPERQASDSSGLGPTTSTTEDLATVHRGPISIQITPDSQDASLAHPGEPKRYLATEFEDQLQKIIANEQLESYWFKGHTSKPPPVESGRSNLLSVKSGLKATARRATDKKDYGKPNLDPENWKFVDDNDFARYIFTRMEEARFLPLCTTPVSNSLCDKCAIVRKEIWSPLFKYTNDTATLKQNAINGICDLCSLFWHTVTKFLSQDTLKVTFQRRDSTLMMDGVKLPVLTLLRNNEARSRATDVQIGLASLPSPGGDAHFEILRGWLYDCDRTHQCRPRGNETLRMPTRLIDVGTNVEDVVHLRETNPSDKDDWIALSYRWGPMPHTSTTVKNKKAHMAGMNLKQLPRTFQDAIQVTRRLEKRYLWIDSLCIIQGEGGDFSDESKRMEDVYSGAYCVIAASCATDQNSGFLLPREKKREYVALEADKNADGIFYLCQRLENFNDHVLEGELSRRGWVLQEHALARRTIFFTEHQTYWECGKGIRCETLVKMENASAAFLGDPEFPKLMNPTTARKGEQIKRFQDLYRQYSRLALSTDHDRPAAIDGLQMRLLKTMNVQGGFGVFDGCDKNKGFLRRSLLWRRGDDISTLRTINFPNDRQKVPSWSWMAVSGGIDYFSPSFDDFHWPDLKSPWSSSVHVRAEMFIEAQSYKFDLSVAESHQHKIVFDDSEYIKQDQTRAIVVGIEKGRTHSEHKKHYILVVDVKSAFHLDGRLNCNRVGAGWVLGKCLEGESLLCALY